MFTLVDLVSNITVTTGGCWEWQGSRDSAGYGRFGQQRVHRLSDAMSRGDLPRRVVVHHTCENPPCVNPDHLVRLTRREHVAAHAELRLEDDLSTCKHGHPWAENAFMEGAVRRCLACRQARAQTRRKTPLGESNYDRARSNTCKHGHSLDDAWIDRNGTRKCRSCNRERAQARREAERAERGPLPPREPSTMCLNGHVYADVGVYEWGGKRMCRECRREADRRRYTPSV